MLPEIGFLRLPQIIGNPKAKPPIPPIIPISKSAWWAGVKTGDIPRPVKLLGTNISAWSVDTIRELVEQINEKIELAKITSHY